MNGLIECVPNFSEGRDASVIDAIAEAIGAVPGIALLDRTSDVDHNRSVLTFAGAADDVGAAVEAATAIEVNRIDLRLHRGQHPRIGALDVVPFVPVGDTTMAACVALARSVGARLADRFQLPVYLYANAATRPDRRVLADIRRPQFEGLARAMAAPRGEPDFGPRSPHPSAGATVVGARPFLIAWNINLETDDVTVAKRIASSIRERNGGLPRVQALGLMLEDLGCAQVSMNLLDFRVTPMWRVWELVRTLANDSGIELRDSELIGLAPVAALTDTAHHAGADPSVSVEERVTAAARLLRIRDFQPEMALELRLQHVLGGQLPMTPSRPPSH
jgi:glutamate formiminotransferase